MTPGDATVEELKQRLDQGEDIFILDVRNPDEYQICRLPNSTLIPLMELPARFRELDPNREIVVYCRSGGRSQRAAMFLRQQGLPNVRNLQGGILAWADRIDPTVPKY
jgi:adenylyltransferase/sulfurtransferase